MKARKFISAVLCAAIISAVSPAAGFAAEAPQDNPSNVTGSIKATLCFNYPQMLSKVREKGINITLYKGDEEIGAVSLGGEATVAAGAKVHAVIKNTEGVELTNESEIGYFDVDVS